MTVYIVDIIREVVQRCSTKLLNQLKAVDPTITKIYFEYGHYTDIQKRLAAYSKIGQNTYPLIALFEDFPTDHGTEGYDGLSNLKVIILYLSKPDITRIQRDEKVFKPILYPIYREFLKQLKYSGAFNIYDETQIQHRQINRPHWGDPALYKNDGYLFSACLDGIEMTDFRLETFLKTC